MIRTIIKDRNEVQLMGYEVVKKNGKSIKAPVVRIGNTELVGGMTFILADKKTIYYRETSTINVHNIFRLFTDFIMLGKPLRY